MPRSTSRIETHIREAVAGQTVNEYMIKTILVGEGPMRWRSRPVGREGLAEMGLPKKLLDTVAFRTLLT